MLAVGHRSRTMASCPSQYFFFLLVITVHSSTALRDAEPARCIKEHHDLLLLFKNALKMDVVVGDPGYGSGPNPGTYISYWEAGTDCCLWKGVTCGEVEPLAGHVTKLYLGSSHLYGNIHPALFNLTSLTSLYMSGVPFLNVAFPSPGMEKLKNLNFLALESTYQPDSCSIDGNILVSISRLSNLGSLRLRGCRLTGQPPLALLSNLRLLSILDLSMCGLSGPIPQSFRELTQLSYLDLSNNNLAGPIPQFFVELTRLSDLYLSNNNLAGPIPDNLTQVSELDLSHNRLSGAIPKSLLIDSNLTSLKLDYNNLLNPRLQSSFRANSYLKEIYLDHNQLDGPIPKIFFEMTNLETLSLDGNRFTLDTCFNTFKDHENLTRLFLSGMTLNIDDCEADFLPPSIEYLSLSSCNLTKFPDFLRDKDNLYHLDISRNMIEGLIPDWVLKIGTIYLSYNLLTGFEGNISKMDDIDIVVIQSNKFHGQMPIIYNPITLDYTNNFFTGTLPKNIGLYLQSTQYFSLSQNMFVGKIPHSICQAQHLQYLDLSHNNFIGSIPSCLFNLWELTTLNLQGNKLTGVLSIGFDTSCTLETLNVNGNMLRGTIPRSLSQCNYLVFLDLGNNEFHDVFPSWLLGNDELRFLSLRNNKLYGLLPKTWYGNFSKVQILDLSLNKFGGIIPSTLLQCLKALKIDDYPDMFESDVLQPYLSTMYYTTPHQSIGISSKGVEYQLNKTMIMYNALDLSSNAFKGDIPTEIGELISLKVLNLSHNRLVGNMPHSLGMLRQIESMDLSWNQISGKIPMELNSLNFLAVLNLSYNKLEGEIPHGSQVTTFQWYSYIGNKNLCGEPSPKECGKKESMHPLQSSYNSRIEPNWCLISIEIGLVVGLALWYACLIFSTKIRAMLDEIIYVVQTRILCLSPS